MILNIQLDDWLQTTGLLVEQTPNKAKAYM